MCGIYAYIGKKNKIFKQSYEALKVLRSRGYDSYGLSWFKDNKINLKKSVDKELEKTFTNDLLLYESNSILTHTRWATNGVVSLNNTHPFLSENKKFALVHNGIIENANILKKELQKYKKFSSETDSEVIVNLLEYEYETNNNNSFEKILINTFNKLKGYWSVIIMKHDEPYNLYVTRKETPMVIGYNKNEIHISSDYNTFSNYVNSYFEINNNDFLKLSYDIKNDKIIDNFTNIYKINKIEKHDVICNTPMPYKYWLEKEIFEQNLEINNLLLRNNIFCNNGVLYYDEFDNQYTKLNFNYKNIILLGSGTSYHASMLGELFLKINTNYNVRSFNVSDFSEYDIPNIPTLFIIISQSGETKDIYDMIIKIKNISTETYKFLSITNSLNSLIPRNCDINLYLKLTKEISVASTKTFTCSSLLLYILSLKIGNSNDNDYLFNLSNTYSNFYNKKTHLEIKNIAETVYDKNLIFLASSYKNLPIAMESNLKIQEICYKYSISSCAKNLKHGPLALIDENACIFHFISDKYDYDNSKNVANEIKSRNGNNYLFTCYKNVDETLYDKIIYIDTESKYISNILLSLPAQLLTLYIGDKLNNSIDYPKNLAKTVTV